VGFSKVPILTFYLSTYPPKQVRAFLLLLLLWNTWHPKHLIFTRLQQVTSCEQLAIHKTRQLTDWFTYRQNPVTWRLHKEQKTVFECTWNTSDRSSLIDLDLCDFISSHAVMREIGRMVLLIRWIMCCQQWSLDPQKVAINN
jgi:hypothetical protein